MTNLFRYTVGVLACPLVLSACTPPGDGPKALTGFKASAAIIQGLGEYHSKNGAYPDTLALLVPAFLTSLQLSPPHGVGRYDYSRKANAFSLGFSYHGPGSNTCTFDSIARAWACSGHF